MHKRISILLLACALTTGALYLGARGDDAALDRAQDMLAMSAPEFDAWITSLGSVAHPDGVNAGKASQALLARLEAGLWVPDETVRRIIDGHIKMEHSRVDDLARDRRPENYRESFALLDRIEPLLYKRPTMSAWLHARRGYLLTHVGSNERAAEEFEKAREPWHALHLEIDVLRVQNLVDLGGRYYVLGIKDLGDARLLEAYTYPWIKVDEAKEAQILRELHIRAVRGLIELRRGDAAALRNIRLIPAIKPTVQEQYDNALREADGLPPKEAPEPPGA